MSDKPLILSVETATRSGSVCLMRGDELVASVMGDARSSHSNTLLREIKGVLEKGKVVLSDVKLLAAASGPGSFTGIRIGLASIKGLAATLRLPGIGVPTLQAIARAGGPAKVSLALLPAGRGELFAQLLSVMPDETVIELDQPVHISPKELLERYRGQRCIRWCGEGAHAHRDEIRKWAHDEGIDFSETSRHTISTNQNSWTLAPSEPMLARHVAALALLRFSHGATGDPRSLRALYVRPSDAEINKNVNVPPSS